ncbi:NAD-dependent epimerase/dehydratase family protein [Gorillibacterium sp. sgz5001074]|uniref:NAD-dependent epimerase/dehydratase family protein n=1 Tax=Gorillibacterium sp. sgz5001074 TaxID=3446695 RepID=UPI003F680BDA
MANLGVVTGGAGFIGSHLTDLLIRQGWKVHVIDSLTTGTRERVNSEASFHECDIASPEAGQLIVRLRPDAVFHLAAQADVQTSLRSPSRDAGVNLLGTVRLLEACREAGGSKLIFSSTSGVYGDHGREVSLEEDGTSPISFYGLSKLAGEEYVRMFHRLFGLPCSVLRYANVYGPRQTAKGEGGVVALFTNRLLQGEPLVIYGDGEQTRDFIYVEDVAEANLRAYEAGGAGETVQIGTSRATTVNRLAELLTSIHGQPVQLQREPSRPGDIRHSCLSYERAEALLGWSPHIPLEQGLERTYQAAVHHNRGKGGAA